MNSARALVFHMNIIRYMTFPWVPTINFWPYDHYLGAWPTFWKTFSHSKSVWTVSACVYAFDMIIFSGNSFPWVSTFFFNSVTLIMESYYFFKTLTFLKTFEQWVLKLWYSTWIFYETMHSPGNQHFWPCDLDPWPLTIFYKTLILLIFFWIVSATALEYHMNIPCVKIFLLVLNLFTLTFDQF